MCRTSVDITPIGCVHFDAGEGTVSLASWSVSSASLSLAWRAEARSLDLLEGSSGSWAPQEIGRPRTLMGLELPRKGQADGVQWGPTWLNHRTATAATEGRARQCSEWGFQPLERKRGRACGPGRDGQPFASQEHAAVVSIVLLTSHWP